MKRILAILLSVLLATSVGWSQTGLRIPVISASSTNIVWTAGTVNNGGHAVAITAGSTALGASKTDCAAPTYTTCNILYSNSSGTVSLTTTIATAAASGNVILAFIETTAGSVASRIVVPTQSGTLGSALVGVPGGAGSASTFTSTVATGTAPFVSTSTTPATNVNAFAVAYNAAGTQQVTGHVVFGTCTLGTSCSITLVGAAAFTSTATYYCAANDRTSAAAVKIVNTAASTIDITGTATDVIGYVCFGN